LETVIYLKTIKIPGLTFSNIKAAFTIFSGGAANKKNQKKGKEKAEK